MDVLSTIRKLASQNSISYTDHALQQMFDRNIEMDVVKSILSSESNQLIETQSKSNTPGKKHANDRYLIYSPTTGSDVIVVSIIQTQSKPTVRVITAEYADDNTWDRAVGRDPALIRK